MDIILIIICIISTILCIKVAQYFNRKIKSTPNTKENLYTKNTYYFLSVISIIIIVMSTLIIIITISSIYIK